jgi:hypothetical protein
MINRSKLDTSTELFPLLVKLDVFDENQNIDLLRFDIPTEFSSEIRYRADHLADTNKGFSDDGSRRDLTDLLLMTIDGQSMGRPLTISTMPSALKKSEINFGSVFISSMSGILFVKETL